MRWKGRKESSNVEDRRGLGKTGAIGGGIGIIMLLIYVLLGGDPGQVINNNPINNNNGGTYQETAQEKELSQFVSVVLADTETVWTKIFDDQGLVYEKPILVLYSGSVDSACGTAGSSTGPFYCSGDKKLYIDLSFFAELKERFQAPGDFAIAYVVAHEVGHHIQNELGIIDQLADLRSSMSEEEYNQYSVRLELQADYLAGVWAHYAEDMNLLEKGDLEEALKAAEAVGDDRIQKQSQGYIVPDSFTHGTSEQRMRWFYKGYQSGNLEEGDTFNTDEL
ncbi:MAG: metalloprotease [Eubacteriaceae bacterium]|nr:metalloprotease [Eubacteriaceae bacterium]